MQLTKHWAATLDDYVIDLGWSPDGTVLAAASAAGPVHVFAAADGALRHQLPGHENGTNCLAWQPASQTSEVRGQRSEGRSQTPDAGGQTAEAGGQEPDVRSQISEVSSERSDVTDSALTSDLRPLTSVLATGGQDGAVKLWDAMAGQHTATANLGSAWVEHLAWRAPRPAPDVRGQRTEVRGQRPEAESQISDTARREGESRERHAGKTERPAESAASLTSDLRPLTSGLLFAAAGRTLTALRPDASIAHTFKPAPKTISALAMQPAGGSVAASYFGGVVLWDTDDFIAQKELPYGNGIHALVWSPDSRWLVSGNQDPSVHLWIPEQNEELHMSGYETKVKCLSFDPTSRWLATSGGRDGCVWDCSGAGPEGREPVMLPHEAPICAVKFQHAHGLLATASEDGVVQLWSPERRQPLRATVRMPSSATKLAWSPDDGYLAIGSRKGVVYVLKCEP